MTAFALRPYQLAARDAVYREWAEVRSTLLVMATGTGKTATASAILRERADRGRILWIAHRSELLAQARDTLERRMGLTVEVEQADRRAARESLWGASDAVVASVQTLRDARLRSWSRNAFATIVVDEAHHASARSYREILGHFEHARVLGLTATPDRSDGVALGGVFDSLAYEYDLRTAVREGYLAPIRLAPVTVDSLDLSSVRVVAGDLSESQLAARMSAEEVLHQIAAPLAEQIGDRSAIVFTPGVEVAGRLAEIIAGYGITATSVSGKTPPAVRDARLAAYGRGDTQCIVNCAVLTEGFDAPRTSLVALARPTKSRSLYSQMVGRGTRLFPGKTDCLVMDFRGNCGRHQLVEPADIFSGKPLPDDVRRRAAELEREMPSLDALEQAEREAEERERAAEERASREAKIRARVAYQMQIVDPFGLTPTQPSGGPSATPAQIEYLRGLGVRVDERAWTKRDAAKALDELAARRRKGLCSLKQARVLARAGLRTDLSSRDASAAIDALANAGWRASPELRARYGEVSDV